MISATSHHVRTGVTNRDAYERRFVPRIHRLILLGYGRMPHSKYASEQETTITGDLVDSINEILDAPPEKWMKFYSVHDDPPVNERKGAGNARRKGRSRRRVDIRFDSAELAPRLRFRFECKRLGPKCTVKKYLGPDGLGCFLASAYARDDVQAGMLGYLQSDDHIAWALRIEKMLIKLNGQYSLRSDSPWRNEAITPGLPSTYRSGHGRGNGRPSIEIYHTLLAFV